MQVQRSGPIQKSIKYTEADEHILRRLANALVLHWDELSDPLQDLIIDQAVIVADRQDAPHSRDDIENFLRAVKIGSSRPKVKPQAT